MNNVTVTKFQRTSELTNTSSTVCIDEICLRDVSPADLNNIKSRNIWVVIRDPAQYFMSNLEQYIRNQFTDDWVVVNLDNPLRTSKIISEKIKDGMIMNPFQVNEFNESLNVPANMRIGPEPIIIRSSEGSYQARLQKAFYAVGNDKPALIIMNWLNPKFEEVQEARKTTTNKKLAEATDSVYLLIAIEALKACNRPKPLLWFESSEIDVPRYGQASTSDDKEDVKEWMRGTKTKDLITDAYCMAGYEADVVIDLGGIYIEGLSDQMAKCRSQYVHITSD